MSEKKTRRVKIIPDSIINESEYSVIVFNVKLNEGLLKTVTEPRDKKYR